MVQYEIVQNIFVEFVRKGIGFLIGLTVLLAVFGSIIYVIYYLFSNTKTFISTFFSIFKSDDEENSSRTRRKTMYVESIKPKKNKPKKVESLRKYKKVDLVDEKYKGMTADEIEREMNRKY